jgi:hypothetical protein
MNIAQKNLTFFTGIKRFTAFEKIELAAREQESRL